MGVTAKNDDGRSDKAMPNSQPALAYKRYPEEKSDRTTEEADAAVAQAEFLHDIRVSLKEMQAGKTLPAEDALTLIELGLDDDALESRLPK